MEFRSLKTCTCGKLKGGYSAKACETFRKFLCRQFNKIRSADDNNPGPSTSQTCGTFITNFHKNQTLLEKSPTFNLSPVIIIAGVIAECVDHIPSGVWTCHLCIIQSNPTDNYHRSTEWTPKPTSNIAS